MRRRITTIELLATSVAAPTPQFPSGDTIASLLRRRVRNPRKSGIVIGLLDGSERRHIAIGAATRSAPLDEDSVLEIASVTKTITGIALAAMSLRGMVHLDDPVDTYLPGTVRMPSRNGRPITLLDLATHRSGLPRIPPNLHALSLRNPYRRYTVERLYDALRAYTLKRDIGSAYEYSNFGAGLLGHVLALRYGDSYDTMIRRLVLEPLGMTRSGVVANAAMQAKLACGHGGFNQVVPNWEMNALTGAGGMLSTAADLLQLVAANVHERGPLSEAMSLARQPRFRMGNMSVGLCWHIVGSGDCEIVWHNGMSGGFRSFVAFNTASKRGVVALTNSLAQVDDLGMHLMNPAVTTDLWATRRDESDTR